MGIWIIFNFIIIIILLVLTFLEKPKSAVKLKISKRETLDDCRKNDHLCLTNAHCLISCQQKYLTCNNLNLCSNESKVTSVCNEKHGILPIYTANFDSETTSIKCRSLSFPFIWDHEDNLREGICSGGEFIIDLTKEDFDPYKCKCPGILTVFNSILPVCSSRQLFPL